MKALEWIEDFAINIMNFRRHNWLVWIRIAIGTLLMLNFVIPFN